MVTRTALRVSRVALGVVFLGLGVVGLFLPLLQGVLFMIVGLSLLSSESTRARRCLDWLRGVVQRQRTARPGEFSDGA